MYGKTFTAATLHNTSCSEGNTGVKITDAISDAGLLETSQPFALRVLNTTKSVSKYNSPTQAWQQTPLLHGEYC